MPEEPKNAFFGSLAELVELQNIAKVPLSSSHLTATFFRNKLVRYGGVCSSNDNVG